MNYEELVTFLYAQLPVFHREGKKALKPGLSNIKLLLEKIGNPQDQFKSLHIAGTNGKGSSSHFMASILQEQGYKVGLYTSPHLKSFTERIKINGSEVPKDWVIDFFERYQPLLSEVKPSFFEWTVAMAFSYFQEEKVDFAVIETGLGGRLDSTNIIKPIASYITNIGYDHQDILGNTLMEIAAEKAGIIKSTIPVMISERQEEIEHVFLSHAKTCNATIQFAENLVSISNIRPIAKELHVNLKSQFFGNLKIESPYAGSYQAKNCRGVVAWCEQLIKLGVLEVSKQSIVQGIKLARKNTKLRGRWDIISTEPWIVADTAHNESGINEVIKQVEEFNIKKLHVILGMVSDKNIDHVLTILPKNAYYYFTQASNPRILSAKDLHTKALSFGLQGEESMHVDQAIKKARKTNADFILITGSTYLVAEITD
jgi:dihydrofolate synthase/folylpolyglutamate synthase